MGSGQTPPQRIEVPVQDGVVAIPARGAQLPNRRRREVPNRQRIVSGRRLADRHQDQVLLQPRADARIGRRLDLLRPIPLVHAVIVIEPADAGMGETDVILASRQVAASVRRVPVPVRQLPAVLDVVQQDRQLLRGQVGAQPLADQIAPYLAGTGGQAGVREEIRPIFDADDRRRPGAIPVHVRLVDPSAGQTEPVGKMTAALRPQFGRTPAWQARVRLPLQDHVLDAQRPAQLPLAGRVAIFVDHEVIRANGRQLIAEIEHAEAGGDHRLLDRLEVPYDVRALLLTIGWIDLLQHPDAGVRTDHHVQIAERRCLHEKLEMSRVKQIETSAHHHLLVVHLLVVHLLVVRHHLHPRVAAPKARSNSSLDAYRHPNARSQIAAFSMHRYRNTRPCHGASARYMVWNIRTLRSSG